MRALGFAAWVRQTVQRVEREKRRLVAEEILGLAVALETSVAELMSVHPADAVDLVSLPSGAVLPPEEVEAMLGGKRSLIQWDGATPVFPHDQLVRFLLVAMSGGNLTYRSGSGSTGVIEPTADRRAANTELIAELTQMRAAMRGRGEVPPDLPTELAFIEEQGSPL
jgi:hypothetical protein